MHHWCAKWLSSYLVLYIYWSNNISWKLLWITNALHILFLYCVFEHIVLEERGSERECLYFQWKWFHLHLWKKLDLYNPHTSNNETINNDHINNTWQYLPRSLLHEKFMIYEIQYIMYSQGWGYKEATNVRDKLKAYVVLATNNWISMHNL